MSISGTRGHVILGFQSGKGAAALTADRARIRLTGESFAIQEMVDTLPIEIAGSLFPQHVYKTGVFGAGAMSLIPRLGFSAAYLLQGIASNASAAAAASGSAYVHTFAPAADQTALPWLEVDKYVPGPNGNDGVAEHYSDVRMAGLTLNLAAGAPLTAEAAFLARQPTLSATGAAEPSETVHANDVGSSIGLACTTGLAPLSNGPNSLVDIFPNATFTNATIAVANQFTRPQDEMVINSYYPDDFVAVGRTVAIALTYKFNDPKIYRALLTGAIDGTTWSPSVVEGNFNLWANSTKKVNGGANTQVLHFTAPNVRWVAGALTLTPQRIVMMQIIGQVIDGGTTPYTFKLLNETAAYTWTS